MGKFTTEEEANGGFNIAEVNIPIWSHGDLHMEIYLLQVLEIFKVIVEVVLGIVVMKTYSTARFKLLEE